MVSFVLYPFGGILTFQLLSSVVCLLVWEPKGWHSIDAMAPLVGSLVHCWLHLHFCDCVSLRMTAYDVLSSLSVLACQGALRNDTWLILPVVICLSQRLSHACCLKGQGCGPKMFSSWGKSTAASLNLIISGRLASFQPCKSRLVQPVVVIVFSSIMDESSRQSATLCSHHCIGTQLT
ncbi:hypothetical protein DM860_017809 [Cuscuta australis]|uniref:Uncharacterized protein n=1 Tax=Cuscuta australis TaxID=267555 RepID=A0A328DQU9_9ASTE|nr:hypothetical protein DM860_017809 [Cuscuta australis]